MRRSLLRPVAATLFSLTFALPAHAERILEALPMRETFDAAGDYDDIVWETTDCHHSWSPDGYEGGAAKFTPPTVEQGSCGLGQFIVSQLDTIPEQLNARFLILHGPTWIDYGPTNKLVIMNRDGNEGRPMIITRRYPDMPPWWETWGPCDGTVCRYEGGDFFPDGTDSLRIGHPPDAREMEWISVELEANTTTGMIRLYVDTQDGELEGLYVERPMDDTGPGGTWSFIDVIGGYIQEGSQADAGNYYMIDDLVIDSSYIGPPAGFPGGVSGSGGGGAGGAGAGSGSGGGSGSVTGATSGSQSGGATTGGQGSAASGQGSTSSGPSTGAGTTGGEGGAASSAEDGGDGDGCGCRTASNADARSGIALLAGVAFLAARRRARPDGTSRKR